MFKLYKVAKHIWWQVLIIIGLVAGQSLLQLRLPDFINEIQIIVGNAGINPLTREDTLKMFGLGGAMIGIAAAIMLLAVGQGLLNSRFVSEVGRILRRDIFTKVETYSLTNINDIGTASLLTRLTNDTRVVQNFMFMINRVFVMSPIFLIIGSGKLLRLDPMYFYIVLVALPIILIIMVLTFVIASPIFIQIQERLDYVTLLFREGLTGVRVIRAFNQEEREKRFFDDANKKMTNVVIKVNNIMTVVQPTINIFFNLAYFGIYFMGFVILNNMLTGQMPYDANAFSNTMAASMYVQNIMMSFLMLSFAFIMFPQVSASAKRINAVLNVTATIVDPEQPLAEDLINEGVVTFNDVTFTFSDIEHPTLKNINFTAKPGTVTAIVGSTGSGKSSIINLLPRFHDANLGSITFDSHDVKNFKMHDLRSKIGFVPQTAILFSGTIRDNLKFGKEDATDEEMWEALKVAQASDFVSRLPLGLDAPVAQGGKNFSGGQKQRLAIARALVRKPLVYVFDDSFSALDFRTDIRLRTALREYAKHSTIFIVAQRISSIMDANQILVLNEGVIVGLGTHNELVKSCSVYQEIVTSQLDAEEIKKSRDLVKSVALEGGN